MVYIRSIRVINNTRSNHTFKARKNTLLV